MRIRYAPFYAAMLIVLTACSTLGLEAPKTFNERLAAGYQTVAGIRDSAGTLYTASKITVADARNVQRQSDGLRSALDTARTLHGDDPRAAEDKISATIAALTELQKYLANRK